MGGATSPPSGSGQCESILLWRRFSWPILLAGVTSTALGIAYLTPAVALGDPTGSGGAAIIGVGGASMLLCGAYWLDAGLWTLLSRPRLVLGPDRLQLVCGRGRVLMEFTYHNIQFVTLIRPRWMSPALGVRLLDPDEMYRRAAPGMWWSPAQTHLFARTGLSVGHGPLWEIAGLDCAIFLCGSSQAPEQIVLRIQARLDGYWAERPASGNGRP